MTYCNSCRSLEGKHSLATPFELRRAGVDVPGLIEVEDCFENYICGECGEVGSIQSVPEHDDYDMER